MIRILLLGSAVLVLAFSLMSCNGQSTNGTAIQQETITAANISLTGLTVSPTIVQRSEEVLILVEVTNNGGTAGTYLLNVDIDGVQQINESVIISDTTIKTFNYGISINKGGTYNVTVGDMDTQFTVLP